MCLIIDANFITLVLGDEPTDDGLPVKTALLKRRAKAVYGGKLTREYEILRKYLRTIKVLDQVGIFYTVLDVDVDTETDVIIAEGLCESDDPHIIALARVANVKLVCSHDKTLHIDFTNPKLIRQGKVYQTAEHEHLIDKHCKKKRKSRK